MKVTDDIVLYEDNHLIAINKQVGHIVQGDKTGDTPLSELVKDYLKIKYEKPGNVFCGVIHRLDRPVSGCVLFAKTSKGLERMNKMFQEKLTEKKYWAIVKNKPKEIKGTLTQYLVRNEKQNKSYAYNIEKPNSQKAILDYELILSSDNYHLLEITLHTGRHHQIRCQLASMGSPIKGDLKYGFDRSNKDAGINLHSRSLAFTHPINDTIVNILAPVPKEALWQWFEKEVRSKK